jgi:8-oxo-dGTP pyrophosphatase MutT (NUDIX family)
VESKGLGRQCWSLWRKLCGGNRVRVSCLLVREHRGEDEILLIGSLRRVGHWVIPDGGVDYGETDEEAAGRELEEEAGMQGEVVEQIGVYIDTEGCTKTIIFILRPTAQLDEEHWPEHCRGRWWYRIEEAKTKLAAKHSCIFQLFLDRDSKRSLS